MTRLGHAAMEFHRMGVIYIVDRVGNLHAMTLPEYAGLTPEQFKGATLFMTHASAAKHAAKIKGRS